MINCDILLFYISGGLSLIHILWLGFFSCRTKKNRVATAGFTIHQVLLCVALVFLCIFFLMLILSFAFILSLIHISRNEQIITSGKGLYDGRILS